MPANRCARGFVFFLVLMLTSIANLLFVPVDSDGDESTPPVIISFKFVSTPTSARPSPRTYSHSAPEAVLKNQLYSKPGTSFSASTVNFAISEILSMPVAPLRC